MNAGLFVKHFPVISFRCPLNQSVVFKFHGTIYRATRTGKKRYDFTIEPI